MVVCCRTVVCSMSHKETAYVAEPTELARHAVASCLNTSKEARMKKPIAMLSSLLLCALLPAAAQNSGLALAPVASVVAVDLVRYAGTWYEIASFPMFFQRNCVGETTATYAALPDGRVQVTNRCRTAQGFEQAVGHAKAVPGSANSRLKVSFFWPFEADYWVIGLDADYRWAVVGDPRRRYLWLLSRTPQLPVDLLEAALASAVAQGYALDGLRYTQQTEPEAPR
jgi:apolipoprotein D and lipocalin family protein